MSQLTTEEELLVAQLDSRLTYTRELAEASIRQRWGSTDWDFLFPWWREPAKIRILMYADGDIDFSGDCFGGLQYVKTLLERRLYFYADFEITTVHRTGDLCDPRLRATKLTDLDLNSFDEIWFFGFNLVPDLSQAERELLDDFMGGEKRGGVLVTGDHANRGISIAGEITRAGKMRQYPAPQSYSRERNTTLEEGRNDPNEIFDPNDQNDDQPQRVRLTPFPLPTPPGGKPRFRPHPVMSGPDGPIDVFPDHEHEGEAVTPETPCADEWPTVNGHQELPVVIAWGKIKDPSAAKFGQEIGLVSAYDGHKVTVGRIVADSSWHHWFDGNLLGIRARIPPDPHAGFDATPEGRAVLRKLDAFFLNCATWLAPPSRQAEMRNAALWSVVWSDHLVEITPDAPVAHFGAEALGALGQRTSGCAVSDWVLDIPAFKDQISGHQLSEILGQFELIYLPFEQYVVGGIIKELMRTVGPLNPKRRFPSAAPTDEELERVIEKGVFDGVSALTQQLSSEVTLLSAMVASKFSLKSSVPRLRSKN